MARNGGQRTGPFKLPLWSASQAKKRGGCVRRWGFNRLEGRKEPQGKNAIKGTSAHSEMEAWNVFGTFPKTKEACAALRFSPAPGIAEVEVPVRFDTQGENILVPWVGYIDLAYDWAFSPTCEHHFAGNPGKPAAIGSTGITVIHDWKFSSSTDWAMTPDELQDDWAANVYAHEAFEGGAERVFLRWCYSAFDKDSTKEIWAETSREQVDTVLQELHQLAGAGQLDRALYLSGQLAVADLPIDTTKCFDFKAECPFKAECQPELQPREPSQRIQVKRNIMSEAFEQHMNTVAPKKAPPPPPSKKAPPPPPPPPPRPVDSKGFTPMAEHRFDTGTGQPLADNPAPFPGVPTSIGTPEAGSINPPGGPTTAAATPEEAKVLQGIGDKPEPVKDELDGMELHQLKALATAIGADFVPRARSASVIASIRARRLQMADRDALAEDANQEPELDREAMQAAATEARADFEAELAKGDDTVEEVGVEIFEKQIDIIKDHIQERSWKRTGEVLQEKKFTLYINCRANNDGDFATYTVAQFINNLMPDFKEATGFDDYRQVDFGKGVGMMAASIVDELENGRFPRRIVCDTRTQEGFAFCSTFERFAEDVVRGFA